MLKIVIKSFCESWEQLFKCPVPEKFKQMGSTTIGLDWLVKACFPVNGALLALVFYLLALLVASLSAPVGGAIIFAIAATILSEAVNAFRDLNNLGYFITLRLAGADNQSAIRNLQKVNCNSLAIIAQVFTLLIKAVCFGFLFHYSHLYWLVIVFVLSFTMQAQLGKLPDIDSKLVQHPEDHHMRFTFWYVAAFLCLLFFLKAPVLILISFAVCLLYSLSMFAWLWRELGGASPAITALTGYSLQLLLLLFGLMLG